MRKDVLDIEVAGLEPTGVFPEQGNKTSVAYQFPGFSNGGDGEYPGIYPI